MPLTHQEVCPHVLGTEKYAYSVAKNKPTRFLLYYNKKGHTCRTDLTPLIYVFTYLFDVYTVKHQEYINFIK